MPDITSIAGSYTYDGTIDLFNVTNPTFCYMSFTPHFLFGNYIDENGEEVVLTLNE